jgi:hypothetical protein
MEIRPDLTATARIPFSPVAHVQPHSNDLFRQPAAIRMDDAARPCRCQSVFSKMKSL